MINIWQWPDGLVWRITDKPTMRARKKKFDVFMSAIKPLPGESILDVGVSPSFGRATNYLEHWYPYPEKVVAFTNEEKEAFAEFKKRFPKTELVFGDGRNLPFEDNSFDIIFSNAVVEHVGDNKAQKRFISELLRVGKRVFVATPNRLFPVESHTLIPLLHYLPIKPRSWLYTKLGREYYSSLDNLNLLSPNAFRRLFPKGIQVKLLKLRVLGLANNLVAIAKKQ